MFITWAWRAWCVCLNISRLPSESILFVNALSSSQHQREKLPKLSIDWQMCVNMYLNVYIYTYKLLVLSIKCAGCVLVYVCVCVCMRERERERERERARESQRARAKQSARARVRVRARAREREGENESESEKAREGQTACEREWESVRARARASGGKKHVRVFVHVWLSKGTLAPWLCQNVKLLCDNNSQWKVRSVSGKCHTSVGTFAQDNHQLIESTDQYYPIPKPQ